MALEKLEIYFPHFLIGLYLLEFAILAISPLERSTWWAENIPVLLTVAVLVVTYKKFRFSNTSYFLMAIFLIYHTVGGHFTFEKVPFDFFNGLLQALPGDFLFPDGRNNFDRLGHFLVGVFAYPAAELFYVKKWIRKRWLAAFLSVALLGFWAALYEIIEMFYAVSFGGAQAEAFLGSQGDLWDAQKDMLLDILGATVSAFLFYVIYKSKKNENK